METVGPSLLDFSRVAVQAADTSKIKISGQNVGSTKLPTWASTNHAAMTAFVDAMRRELGNAIADATATRLHATLGEDRPLTARLVRESIDEAVRMAQSGLNGRDKFLSDIDPQHGFSSVFDQVVAPLRDKLDVEGEAWLRDAMKREIITRFPPGADNAGDPAALAKFMTEGGNLCYFCSHLLALPIAGLGQTRSGDLVSMGVIMKSYSDEYGGILCQALPAMRALQPQGELKPQTIWQGLFNEPLPEGTPGQGALFRDALIRRVDAHLESLAPGKRAVMCRLCGHMPLDRARDIAVTGRGVTMSDLSAPELSLRVELSALLTGEQLVARDLPRRRSVPLAGADRTTVALPPEIRIGNRHFTVGKETSFVFASEKDRMNFVQGNPSSFSKEIMTAVHGICGGGSADPRQVKALGMLCSQQPLSSLLGSAKGVFHGVVDTRLNEHSFTTVSMSRGEGGVVHVRIATCEALEAVRFSGFASVSYDVAPEGTVTPTEMSVMPVFGEIAQAIATLEGARDLSNEELRGSIAEARQAGTISEWEASRLETRLADRISGPNDLS